MRILVTFAVEAEFAPWLALRKFQKRVLQPVPYAKGFEVYEAECGQNELWVLLTGMGPGFLSLPGALPLGMLAAKAGVEVAISSGLAGSLRKEHQIQEVIVPRHIRTLRDASGVSAHPDLLRLSEEHGAKIVDALLTSDRIVGSGEEKSRLGEFADAVDMESYRIMQEFALANLPAATIRAISDESDEDLPMDFAECLTPQGKVKPWPILRQLLRRPSSVVALVRFGGRSRKAAAGLAQFLDSFVKDLTPQTVSGSGMAAR